LIYGLPLQTLEGFGRTLDTVIDARPDRLAIYGYAHMPRLFKAQRQIRDEDLPDPETRLALLELAVERLGDAGYEYIGMDHFALPGDELARARREGGLHRNFMGYTTHAQTDLVGLGVSAISHVGDSYVQNHRDLPAWEAAVDQGRLPLWRGLAMGTDDVLRAERAGLGDRFRAGLRRLPGRPGGGGGGRACAVAPRQDPGDPARARAVAYHCHVLRPVPGPTGRGGAVFPDHLTCHRRWRRSGL